MTADGLSSHGGGLSAHLAPGTRVGGYRIEAFIGRGGMAFVYEATDLRLERHVALKVLAPELSQDFEFQQRFLRESRYAASLDHPNIVPIYEAGEFGGLLYMAMRHVAGGDLGELIERDGSLDARCAVRILSAVAGALDTAHAAGLVHRDVKPGNILLTSGDPASAHVYLSDFGLTKRTSSLSKLTASGMFTGTMAYVAPEQIRGQRLDARSDLYALGCVAHECLTGVPPFVRDDQAALLWAHLSESPVPLSSHRSDLAAADPVLARALAKDPEDRYQSGAEFIAALRTALLPERHVPGQERAAETAPRMRVVDPRLTSAGNEGWDTTHGGVTAATVMREKPSVRPPRDAEGLGQRLAGWVHGRRRWVVPVLAVVLAAALGGSSIAFLGSGDAPRTAASASVSLPFALETYDNGVEVSRTWTLAADGGRLHAEVVMVGGAPGATFDEVIPKSLAASADLVTSDPPPLEVVRQDPVLRYAAPAAPGEQTTLTYDIDVEVQPPTLARLEAWAADQRRERDEYFASVQAPPPTTVDSLTIRPDRLSLRVDSPPHLLSLSGTRDDGRPTEPAELVEAIWTSSDAGVASVDRAGVVTARGGGTVTIVARLGPTRAEAVVDVLGPRSPASAGTPAEPGLPSSQVAESGTTGDAQPGTRRPGAGRPGTGSATEQPGPGQGPGQPGPGPEPEPGQPGPEPEPEPEPGPEPGPEQPAPEQPGTEPSTEPGTEPGPEQPGTEPGTDPGTEPGTEQPGTEPGTEQPATEPGAEQPATEPGADQSGTEPPASETAATEATEN